MEKQIPFCSRKREGAVHKILKTEKAVLEHKQIEKQNICADLAYFLVPIFLRALPNISF
jgi:hypothetical protein